MSGKQQQGGANAPPAGVMSGGSPTPEDLQAQQEASEFISNIMMEVQEHDMKQAAAMQDYMRKLKFWQRWSIFGGKNLPKAVEGNHIPVDHAAASPTMGSSTKQTMKDGTVFERSRAGTASALDKAALTGSAAAAAKAAQAAEDAKFSPYLFKKINPHYVPLLLRWWIPYVAAVGLVVVWSPDPWKLRTLYYLDWQYDQMKMSVHKTYWKAVMPADEYDQLVRELEANIAKKKRIKSPDCPF